MICLRIFAVLFLAFASARAIRCETLADVLAAHQIPAAVVAAADLRQPITGYAVSANDSPFLLAYYDDDGTGTLPSLLHVIRYDPQTHALHRADLRGTSDEPFHGFEHVMAHPSSLCMGSALAISESAGFITIDTHINPSAGCVLILKSDLSFSAGLFGWVVAKIDGNIIFEENTIQFAPTHPGRLSIFDPRHASLVRVYPMKADLQRDAFARLLQKHLPSSQWCAENNNPCDPENFSVEIGPVRVREPDHGFEFDARMSADGFGEEAAISIESKTVHYLCRRLNGRWVTTTQ